MGFSDINDPRFIDQAIAEFRELGREAFLDRYGYSQSRDYVLVVGDERFDSKAIVGVAHRFANPDYGPLRASEFSGGERTVALKLRRLGFDVVRERGDDPDADSVEQPLVLVENESTYEGAHDHWEDVTGTVYHFPNGYVNKVLPGRRVVYYRGVRRAGGERGAAEYFGIARIGERWADPANVGQPKNRWRWKCSIEEFTPFAHPVPATENGRARFEEIDPENPREWGIGVRLIDKNMYERLVMEGGLPVPPVAVEEPTASDEEQVPNLQLPRAELVTPVETSGGMLLRPRNLAGTESERSAATARQKRRRSKHSKKVGDQAEAVVHAWLRKRLDGNALSSLTWPAKEGSFPGWDLQYCDDSGTWHYIEVKGTTLKEFGSIELTANEWAAAERERSSYWVYLVSRCHTSSPVIDTIQDPFGKATAGELRATPSTYLLLRAM